MKIALLGYGKMGKEIESAGIAEGETIVRKFDIDSPAEAAALADADVCIEFSTPDSVLANIRLAIQARKDIVVGTTGWYDQLPEVRRLVQESGQSGLLYSANFSIGMNIFTQDAPVSIFKRDFP